MRSPDRPCHASWVEAGAVAGELPLRRRLFTPSTCFPRLILFWKRLGRTLAAGKRPGLDRGLRPGGLKELRSSSRAKACVSAAPDQQESNSIPRRLVARVCLDALEANPPPSAAIIEVTAARSFEPINCLEVVCSRRQRPPVPERLLGPTLPPAAALVGGRISRPCAIRSGRPSSRSIEGCPYRSRSQRGSSCWPCMAGGRR